MAPPNVSGNNTGILGGIIALVVTAVLLITVIILAYNFSASSSIITASSLIVGVISAFFGFLQVFPPIGKQVASVFSSSSSFNSTNNKVPFIITTLITILVLLNVFQTSIIIRRNNLGSISYTATSHSSPPTTVTPLITPTPTPTMIAATSNPSSVSSPNQLYQANWSQGMNGWSGGPQWSIDIGMLISSGDTQDKKFIVAPYQPTTANYAVEAQIQFLKNAPFPDPHLFGLIARSAADGDTMGYDGYVYDGDVKIRIGHDPNSQILDSMPFALDTSWHTYRLEVMGNTITFFVDGKLELKANDSTFTTPGLVGLFDISCQINVRSFAVYQL